MNSTTKDIGEARQAGGQAMTEGAAAARGPARPQEGEARQAGEQAMREGAYEARAPSTGPTMLERLLPDADIVMNEQVVVMATPEVTYAALKSANYANVGGPLLRALHALRVRAVQRARRKAGLAPLSSPRLITFENMEEYGMTVLAERYGVEIVVGAIMRAGDMASLFTRRTAAEFTELKCAGYLKMAGSFSVARYGENRTLLTYEARARASDTATRQRLVLHSALMSPLKSFAIRRTLDYVKGIAERQCAAPAAYRQTT